MFSPALPTLGTTLIVLLAIGPAPELLPGVPPRVADEPSVDAMEVAPPRGLSREETALWLRGRALFTRRWEEPDGLGTPAFNATSCAHCHSAPELGGAGPNDVNVLGVMGSDGGGYNEPREDKHELGLTGDVQALLRSVRDGEETVMGVHAKRIFERQAPSLFGLALIDSIPAGEIRRNAKMKDTRDDRIRGRVNPIRVARRLRCEPAATAAGDCATAVACRVGVHGPAPVRSGCAGLEQGGIDRFSQACERRVRAASAGRSDSLSTKPPEDAGAHRRDFTPRG